MQLLRKESYIQNRKASFNSHYEMNPQKHEQSIQINPMVMSMILLIGKNIENAIKQPPMNIVTWIRYTSITVVMATHLLAIQIVA